mmetsp:Transcript_27832/g.42098  ORF Transcript_27832/g.42098 Transcript_27832/m.42098 type:complete len:84 (+) Transcript_27832:52-303(+)
MTSPEFNTPEHSPAPPVDDSAAKQLQQEPVEPTPDTPEPASEAPASQNQMKGFILAFMTALFYSGSNFMMTLISYLEIKKIYP